jgi:hypothetical protein
MIYRKKIMIFEKFFFIKYCKYISEPTRNKPNQLEPKSTRKEKTQQSCISSVADRVPMQPSELDGCTVFGLDNADLTHRTRKFVLALWQAAYQCSQAG